MNLQHTLSELILLHGWSGVLDELATQATESGRELRRKYHDEDGAKQFFALENTLRAARTRLQTATPKTTDMQTPTLATDEQLATLANDIRQRYDHGDTEGFNVDRQDGYVVYTLRNDEVAVTGFKKYSFYLGWSGDWS